MLYYIVDDGRIVDGVEIETGREYDAWRDDLEDGQELVTSPGLEDKQIYDYLDDVDSWDDPLVEDLMREMCDRLGLDYDEFEYYCDLFDEITKRLAA